VKALILEYLRLLSGQGKIIPLTRQERVELVKDLLGPCSLHFDFAILGSPKTIEDTDMDQVDRWDKIFDDILYELSEKCPRLRSLREMRPVVEQPELKHQPGFNTKICRLKKLVVLETNCYIDSGNVKICFYAIQFFFNFRFLFFEDTIIAIYIVRIKLISYKN
jgi:hypothetical protein